MTVEEVSCWSKKTGQEITDDSYQQLESATKRIGEHLNLGPTSNRLRAEVDTYLVDAVEAQLEVEQGAAHEADAAVATSLFRSVDQVGLGVDPDDTPIGRVANTAPEAIYPIAEVIETLDDKQALGQDGQPVAVAARKLMLDMDGVSEHGHEELTSHEHDESFEVSTAALMERLHYEEIIDEDGFKRDIYRIHDRLVMFRNRDELPEVADRQLRVIDGDIVPPTGLVEDGISTEDVARYTSDMAARSNEDVIVLATNTPEGVARAAVLAGYDADSSLRETVKQMSVGEYPPGAIALLDSIIAATQYTDTERSELFDVGGYAVVLAALEGDPQAQAVLEVKQAILARDELEKQSRRRATMIEAKIEGGEIADPRHLALVHSTAHEVRRNAAGAIILAPSAAQRPDKFPRSTLHFTVNGQVTSHIMGGWDSANTLIVANLEKTMEQNGAPHTLISADTFFSLNPGEQLTLPGAVTVQSSLEQPELIVANERGDITYRGGELDDSQQHEATALAEQFGVRVEDTTTGELLQEVALRMAEARQGVETFSTIGTWGSTDHHFDRSIIRLARTVGAEYAPHSTTAEGQLETQVGAGNMDGQGGQAKQYVGYSEIGMNEYERSHAMSPAADIRAQRTVIAAGYAPARLVYRGPASASSLPSSTFGFF